MRQEQTIKDDQAVRIFREIFKAAVTELASKGQKISEISHATLMETARVFKDRRQWYLEEAGIDDASVSKFEALMQDYLEDVQTFLADIKAGNEGLPAALHQLFS